MPRGKVGATLPQQGTQGRGGDHGTARTSLAHVLKDVLGRSVLGEKAVHARRNRLIQPAGSLEGSEHDDRHLGMLPSNDSGRLDATDARHLDIEQGHVDRHPVHSGERLGA